MKHIYSSMKYTHDRSNVVLSKTWFFRIASLAFIVRSIPALAVNLHGSIGFFAILLIAILAGLVESSSNKVFRSISKGISQNKLLFVFVVWYVSGFVLNAFFRGEGLADWRLMLTPIIILLGLLYTLAFMSDERCYRNFQISFIILSGLQSVASAQVLSRTIAIAREMWTAKGGSWVYGNQHSFAAYAVTLPVLMWRTFRESGILRLLLLLSCLFIFVASSISAFATPFALIILSAPLILTLSIYLLKRKTWKTVILLVGIIPIIVLIGFRFTYENPLFNQAYYRIENFIRDPESGGYTSLGAASRWDLAIISIETFETEPLFGMGGPREHNPYIGGHSSFFDSLAIYGFLGGGGAICGIILVLLANAIRKYINERNWETLFALTTVILLIVAGIVNPYWEDMIPIVLIVARPINYNSHQMDKIQYPIKAKSTGRYQ